VVQLSELLRAEVDRAGHAFREIGHPVAQFRALGGGGDRVPLSRSSARPSSPTVTLPRCQMTRIATYCG